MPLLYTVHWGLDFASLGTATRGTHPGPGTPPRPSQLTPTLRQTGISSVHCSKALSASRRSNICSAFANHDALASAVSSRWASSLFACHVSLNCNWLTYTSAARTRSFVSLARVIPLCTHLLPRREASARLSVRAHAGWSTFAATLASRPPPLQEWVAAAGSAALSGSNPVLSHSSCSKSRYSNCAGWSGPSTQ